MAGFGALLIAAMRDEKKQAEGVPAAEVVGHRAARKRLLATYLPIGMVVVGLGLAYLMYFRAIEVLVVEGTGTHLEVKRRYSLSLPDTPLAPKEQLSREPRDDVWVINRATRDVRVESVTYGKTFPFGSAPTVIPPNTAATFNDIDHIGPEDPPPKTVRDSVKMGMAFRHWLTWDWR